MIPTLAPLPFFPPGLFLFLEVSQIARIFNFVVFVGVLVYFLRRPLIRYFSERLEAIRRGIEEARDQKGRAESRLHELETRLRRLDVDVAELKSAAEREAAAERERIRVATESELGKLRLLTSREIAGARSATILELKAFTAERAVQLAEALIRSNLHVEDDRRLVREFTEKLGEMRR